MTLGYRNLIIELRKSKPFCEVDADGFASARRESSLRFFVDIWRLHTCFWGDRPCRQSLKAICLGGGDSLFLKVNYPIFCEKLNLTEGNLEVDECLFLDSRHCKPQLRR